MRVDYSPLCVAAFLAAAMVCLSLDVEASPPDRIPLGNDIPAYKAPNSPLNKTEVVEEPTGVISLRHALSLALLGNPSLRSFAWDIRVKEAHELQAGLLPNPEISIESENFEGSGPYKGFDVAETTLQLSQLIELGGKRMKRVKLAEMEKDVAKWNYETARIDTLTKVTKAFVNVLAAQERALLAEELENLAKQAFSVASERVQAGKASPIDRTRGKVELAVNRIESDKARRRLIAARDQLAALWGGKEAYFEKAEGDLTDVTPVPPKSALIRIVSQNPDIARWEAEMERLQASVELEKARGIPNPTLYGAARRFSESGDNAYAVGVSIPLPVFDRNQGRFREARFNLLKAGERRKAMEATVRAALAETYQALSSAYEEVTALEADALPGAGEVFSAASEGYRHGKFGYLEILDAQRVLFETRGRHIDALAAYHRARAEVEKLTGTSIDSMQNSLENE